MGHGRVVTLALLILLVGSHADERHVALGHEREQWFSSNGETIIAAYAGWPPVESPPLASTRNRRFHVSKVVIREPPVQSVFTEAEAKMGVPIEVEFERQGQLPDGSGFDGFDLWLDAKLEFPCVGQEDGAFSGTFVRLHADCGVLYIAICVRRAQFLSGVVMLI
jgi:hypothetical protein